MMTNFNKCASNHILVAILLLLAQIAISHALSSTPRLSRFRHATSLALVDPSAASILVQNLDPNVMTTVIPNGGFLGPFFSSGESSGWLSLLDAAKLPFLPEEVRTGLLKLPIAARIGLNIAAIDFIPTVIEVVFLRTLWSKFMATKQPYREIDISKLPISYDSVKIANFYKKMPKLVLLRVSEISALTSSFLISLLKDYQQTAEYRKSNERSRAAELTELLPKLGPAFVRIGQALSSRVDLCSPVYQEELSKLREEQLILTSDEVSNMIGDIFDCLSAFEKPAVSAGLGQVYKAKLKSTGTMVAVKIQKPYMLLTVTLDLYILRRFFALGKFFPSTAEVCTGFQSTLDVLAADILEQLDLSKEFDRVEKSMIRSSDGAAEVEERQLVPTIYREYSSRNVLVSDWIEDGERIGSTGYPSV